VSGNPPGDTPAVSVIVPSYERRTLLCEAVASVLRQTFTDFELIVVDDGSSDGTREAMAGVDSRVRYVWQPNAGVAAARNRGLELARAATVAFLDSDNRWLPEHLDVLAELRRRHPGAVLASTCPKYVLGGREPVTDAKVVDLAGLVARYGVEATAIVGFISGVAADRKAIRAAGGFDERLRAGEDTDLWARMSLHGPTVTLQRETLVRGVSRDSLRRSARRSGQYLVATERAALNLAAAAEAADGPHAAALRAQGSGTAHLSRSFMALDSGDVSGFASELAAATRELAWLSTHPQFFAGRVRRHLPRADEPEARLSALTAAARHWPDPRGETARFLGLLAVGTALRAGRPVKAARLMARWLAVGGSARFAFAQRRRLLAVGREWWDHRKLDRA
jgi:hypothetical protein